MFLGLGLSQTGLDVNVGLVTLGFSCMGLQLNRVHLNQFNRVKLQGDSVAKELIVHRHIDVSFFIFGKPLIVLYFNCFFV